MIKKLLFLILLFPLFAGAQTLVHPSRISTTTGITGQILKINSSGVYAPADDTGGGGSGAGSDFNYTVAGGGTYLTPTTTTVGLLTGPNASTTIQRLTIVYSTSTQATTTYLVVLTNASTSRLSVSNGFFQDGFSTGCTGAEGETVLYDATTGKFTCGTDADSGAGTGSNWSFESLNAIRPTSTTVGVLLTASSSFDRLFARYATTTESTTSVLSVSGHSNLTTLNVSGAATLPGGVTITCTNCITDTNVADLAVAGDVTGTLSAIAVTDNSHAHDSTSISGIDISADTNLTGGVGLTLTDDDMACDTATSGVFGCLAAADWVTFNAKQNALGYGKTWDMNAGNSLGQISLAPTSTVGLLITSASSTFEGLFAKNATTTNATSTTLNVTGQVDFDTLTSALILTGAGGILAEYTGADCTNQFIRDLSALGAPTCATIVGADVDLADLTATDGTLTFSGAYDGQTARTIGLNLANANTWTAAQLFSYSASTTFSGGVESPIMIASRLVATSTTASSSLQNTLFTQLQATGISATDLTVVNAPTFSALTAANCDVKSSTAGVLSCGLDADSGAGTGSNWTFESQFAIRPTSTAVGILTTSSSTINRLFSRFGTTTEATTTYLSILTYASTTALTVSNLGGSGTSCVQVSATGVLSRTGSACGSASVSDSTTADSEDIWDVSYQTDSTWFAPGGAFFDVLGENLTSVQMLEGTSSAVYMRWHIPDRIATTSEAVLYRVFTATTTGDVAFDLYATTTDPTAGAYASFTWTLLEAGSTTPMTVTGNDSYRGNTTTTPIGLTLTPGEDLIFKLTRIGEDADDTLGNGVHLIKAYIRFASKEWR